MGLAIPTEAMATTSFEQYLKAQGKRNVRQIFCYEKKYHDVLETGDASALMQAKSPAIRRHVLQALCLYLKHTGCYNLFKDNRAKHQLGWDLLTKTTSDISPIMCRDMETSRLC